MLRKQFSFKHKVFALPWRLKKILGVAESRYELSFCRRLVRLLYEKGCALRCRVRNFVERRILTDASFRCATLSMTKSNSYFKSATPNFGSPSTQALRLFVQGELQLIYSDKPTLQRPYKVEFRRSSQISPGSSQLLLFLYLLQTGFQHHVQSKATHPFY